MKNNSSNKRLNFLGVILMIGCIPLLTAILILSIFSISKMDAELESSTYSRLKACATSVEKYFEWDIREGILEKDEVSYEFIDSLKSDGIELTFFENDTRYLTSIKDANSNRVEGTKADSSIWASVKSGNDYSADSVNISGNEYYVYYVPVYDDNGTVIGMAFAGEKEEIVDNAKSALLKNFVVIAIVLSVVYVFILILLALKIRKPLSNIANDIDEIANGNLAIKVESSSVIAETDKLIGASKTLQSKLKEIVSGVDEHVSNLKEDTASLNERASSSNEGAD